MHCNIPILELQKYSNVTNRLVIYSEEEGSGSPENIMSIVGVFEFTAKPEWQTMTSQDYPNPYPNDASFAWQVEAEQETDVIVLQVVVINSQVL